MEYDKEKQAEHIREEMAFHAKNIDEFEIGETVKDKLKNSTAIITDKTKNTIELEFGPTYNNFDGYVSTIVYKNWFTMFLFNKRFSKI